MRKHKKLRSGAPTKRKPPSTRKEQQEEHATASAHHPVRELPGEVLKLIKDRTVDISAASKYWRKAWDIVKLRIPQHWKMRTDGQYKFSAPFFSFFMRYIREKVDQQYGRSQMNGADLIANAFYSAVYLYGRPQLPRSELDEYRRLWPANRPISEAWQRLGTLGVPGGTACILEDPGQEFPLRIFKPRRHDHPPRIGLAVRWNIDQERLPKLTIEIEGEPLCVLMRSVYGSRDTGELRATRKDAKRIWKSLNTWISVDFGIHHLKGGRPTQLLGRESAYLHDHHGLSWLGVAKKLCLKKHKHGSSCRDNYRKQAEQFWKKEKRSLLIRSSITVGKNR